MNLRKELIALAIRLASEKTSLVRRPDPFEDFLNSLFGLESYDRRLASNIDAELTRATQAVKQTSINHKFRKIIQHM